MTSDAPPSAVVAWAMAALRGCTGVVHHRNSQVSMPTTLDTGITVTSRKRIAFPFISGPNNSEYYAAPLNDREAPAGEMIDFWCFRDTPLLISAVDQIK